jgi:hypothetical protein
VDGKRKCGMGKDELWRMKVERDFRFRILDLRFENREWETVHGSWRPVGAGTHEP